MSLSFLLKPVFTRWQKSVRFRAYRLLSQRGTAGGAVPRFFFKSMF